MVEARHPSETATDASALRALPAVDAVLRHLDGWPGAAESVRPVLDELRDALRAGNHQGPVPDAAEVAALVRARLHAEDGAAYPRVVNGTGVFLHTGLGRSPLSPAAAAAVSARADGYTLLEVDETTGDRRDRESQLVDDLIALTGAEAATVVNNNAGALLLALTALARDKEVLVSRGELIEIGGGFRLPDLLEQSGARLREVGTTNRTYAADFARVLTWETGLILAMHTSNYRVLGFQHSAAREELVALGSEVGVPVLEDIGSGLLRPEGGVLEGEPDARSCIAAGVDLVCFSGDKLLGGPQAGVLVGREDLVRRCRRHAMFRALRPDRLSLSALAATLRLHRIAPEASPAIAALSRSPAEQRERARALAAVVSGRFPEARVSVEASEASAGSGSAPARPVPSAAVQIVWPGLTAHELAEALRTGTPPVFGRIWSGQLQLDVLALLPGDDERIVAALSALALRGGATATDGRHDGASDGRRGAARSTSGDDGGTS